MGIISIIFILAAAVWFVSLLWGDPTDMMNDNL